jgi:hypothetical protein
MAALPTGGSRCAHACALLALAALALPAGANDGFGGLSATGLTFGQTEAVAMVSEDLSIGIDRISRRLRLSQHHRPGCDRRGDLSAAADLGLGAVGIDDEPARDAATPKTWWALPPRSTASRFRCGSTASR